MTSIEPALIITAEIHCGGKIAAGPEQMALLEAIRTEGSISAAGRRIGRSYRKTWLMVDEMNRLWQSPLVVTKLNGRAFGGARLSELGFQVLEYCTAMQQAVDLAAHAWRSSPLMKGVLPPAHA